MTCLEAVQAGHDLTAIEKHNFTVLLVWLNLRICTSSTFRIFLFSFNVLVSTLSSGNIRLCNVGCQSYGHSFCVLQVILWYVWLWIRSRLRCLCPPERRLITGPFGNHWTRNQRVFRNSLPKTHEGLVTLISKLQNIIHPIIFYVCKCF